MRIVNAFRVTGKHGTAFLCFVADGEHIIERLAKELVHVLGAMTRNINAKLFHNCNGFGSDGPRFCAGTFNGYSLRPVLLPDHFLNVRRAHGAILSFFRYFKLNIRDRICLFMAGELDARLPGTLLVP